MQIGVYPHKRGETFAGYDFASHFVGLSPQAWGNLIKRQRGFLVAGSIPTSVGKPTGRSNGTIAARVYPHKRGETRRDPARNRPRLGLSPQAWGNHSRPESRLYERGSIPTSVGKPASTTIPRDTDGVYPHKRGETVRAAHWRIDMQGLSPQAWGNLPANAERILDGGSIPTSVGKPAQGKS